MKKILLLFSVILCSCSSSNVSLRNLTEQEQTNLIRANIETYCAKLKEKAYDNMLITFQREYQGIASPPEFGIFTNINIVLDSIEFNTQTLQTTDLGPKHQPEAEISFFISNSQTCYNPHPQLGEINYVGMKFNIDSIGTILDHQYYISCYPKDNQTEEFVYFKEDDLVDISELYHCK